MSKSTGSGFWKPNRKAREREKNILSAYNMSDMRSFIAGINWYKKVTADINGIALLHNSDDDSMHFPIVIIN